MQRGVVTAHEDDALRAVRAALEIQEAAAKLDQEIDDPEVRSEVGRPGSAPARNFSFPHMGKQA
jgi:hypothetical protein